MRGSILIFGGLLVGILTGLVLSGLPKEVKGYKLASKPLYRDPVYDGAADPVVVWNPLVKKWWMFYTSRRATVTNEPGVSWVHGSQIGIAESEDFGATWRYVGNARVQLPSRFKSDSVTLWAPEIIKAPNGVFHMFITVVPGIFADWNHPRSIVQLTSTNLIDWSDGEVLELASDRVIDPCVLRLPDGTWRLWYNNERDRKSIWYADSTDLVNWVDQGRAVGDQPGEGPKVFYWRGYYWMITDVWRGLAVYRSTNAMDWVRQPYNLLDTPGEGPDDGAKGQHADVVVSGNQAFIFYFTHPDAGKQGTDAYSKQRSSIQVAELEYKDGWLDCDRNKPTGIRLQPPE